MQLYKVEHIVIPGFGQRIFREDNGHWLLMPDCAADVLPNSDSNWLPTVSRALVPEGEILVEYLTTQEPCNPEQCIIGNNVSGLSVIELPCDCDECVYLHDDHVSW